MKTRTKIVIFLCILLAIIAGVSFVCCNLLKREATNKDINIDLSQEISFNIQYKVTPNVDIKDLQIEFTYYDANYTFLTRKNKNVGNVTKGQVVTVSISLSEFSFSELLKIKITKAEVIGGEVPLLK